MTALRGVTTQWTSGDTTAEVVLPTCEAGDHLVIFVGGGNHVTNIPTGWDSEFYLTGQEAQGIIYYRDAAGDETGDIVSIDFDGADPRYIAAVAITDSDSSLVTTSGRAGTAGGTLPASSEEWTADQYQGDLLLTFAFCRNAATPPTMDRGTLWEARTGGGSSAALYIESLPEFNQDEPFALDLPTRSGHVYFSLPVWGLVTSEWIQGPDFEVLREAPSSGALSDTRAHTDSATQTVSYPTINQGTFLDDQPLQSFVGDDDPVPASWGHDRFVDLFTDEHTRSWTTFRTHRLWAAQLADTFLNEPFLDNDTFPEDAIGAAEWEAGSATAGSQVVAVTSRVKISDTAADDTDGTPRDLAGGEFASPMYPATGVTWAGGVATDWDRSLGDTSHLIHLHPGALVDSGVPTEADVDLTHAIEGQARVAVTAYVAGPGGTGDPILDLHSYTFEGSAEFGAGYGFPLISQGGGWLWAIRPGRRRHTLRRGPVVDIRPVIVSVAVTRQFPRDDAYGLGSAPRLYPPPRSGRVVGGHM